jgi:hypothetical protein
MNFDLTIVDEYERRHGAKETFQRAGDFMLTFLTNMTTRFPPVAARGLSTAAASRKGVAPASQTEEALKDCWKYIDDRKASSDFRTPEHCIVRATIYALQGEPAPGERVSDELDMFIRLANKFEDRSSSVNPLLEKYFS